MTPTLRESDMLEAAPYGDRPVRRGDVIVFTPSVETRAMVHRVVRVTKEGVRTRGDNNRGDDSWFVRPSDIVGRVVARWRGQRRMLVAGGWAGHLAGRLRGPRRLLNRFLSRCLHAPYRGLARSGLVRLLLPKALAPRVVLYKIDGRDEPQLLFAGRVVGRYNSTRRQWMIHRPFRLLVDESSLYTPSALSDEDEP